MDEDDSRDNTKGARANYDKYQMRDYKLKNSNKRYEAGQIDDRIAINAKKMAMNSPEVSIMKQSE